MHLNNIFGEIQENHVTFVIDTSREMHEMLSTVKNHLNDVLLELSSTRSGFRFNIIHCGTEVIQWSDALIDCSSVTVSMAARWIRDLKCSKRSGNNIIGSLRLAFLDGNCDGVYLVTNGSRDEEASDVLKFNLGRPVHCISLSFEDIPIPDERSEFCEDLAHFTKGSFFVITVTELGDVKKAHPAYNSNDDYCSSRPKFCSVKTSLSKEPILSSKDVVTCSPPVLSSYCWPLPMLNISAIAQDLTKTPVASVVARGTRVLARRSDGYYYKGNIAQEIEGNQSQFLVEFDRIKKGLELRMEEIPIHDIITLNDAERHSVVPGDKVLARWDVNKPRFGPGEVLSGIENRFVVGDRKDTDLVVTFWNGKTVKVQKGQALWIPAPLYDRIVLELQMPITARKSATVARTQSAQALPTMLDDVLEVPFVDPLLTVKRAMFYYPWWYGGYFYLPTYPLLTPIPRYLRCWPQILSCQPHLLYQPWPQNYYPHTVLPYRRRYPVEQPKISDDDLVTKVKTQLNESDTYFSASESISSSSSSDSESDAEVSPNDSIRTWPLKKDKAVNTGDFQFFTTKRSFKTKKRKPRPEWKKYWPQTPQPRMHHRPHRGSHGLYSTWKDPDFGSYAGAVNTRSHFEAVDRGLIKSDRAALLRHLKTPYVEKHYMDTSYGDRVDVWPTTSAYPSRGDEHYRKAKNTEDFKRQMALMRIGSDVEKQRSYEEKVLNTIEAKAKVNQNFRNSFYQKELDHLNKKHCHQRWLQDRQRKINQMHLEKVKADHSKELSRQLGRQWRQAQHNFTTGDQVVARENYDAAVEANKQAARYNRKEHLLAMERLSCLKNCGTA